MKLKTCWFTAGLLLVVFVLAAVPNRTVSDRRLAQQLLNSTQIHRAEVDGPPIFYVGANAVLFFEREGMQGPIRGAIVIQDGDLDRVLILQSREGHDHRVLNSEDFLISLCHQPAKPPLFIDAISGATISSNAVSDAINAQLSKWVNYTTKASGKAALQSGLE